MTQVEGMETFAARLATFDVAYPAGPKSRTSSSKSAKAITWPHRKPSPAELAFAGFYYNPSVASPDNASCYLCKRGLDGWEEEDDPAEEHLKHSSQCGWAIMISLSQQSSNPAEIEDPTSERIAEARRATFGGWPHDGKKGWFCKTEKMVEAGWYFCPTEESEDLASCAYCKLSLDGWEPKDDPYNEHYRRSSECSFFAFAAAPGKKSKASRAKKSRSSKASRLSTQSTATAMSDVQPTDFDEQMDNSAVSLATTKTTKSTKKSSKAKPKSSKAKKEEVAEPDKVMDIDAADAEADGKPRTKGTLRGKKRTSEQISEDEHGRDDGKSTAKLEPAPKRRATEARSSAASYAKVSITDHDPVEVVISSQPAPAAKKTSQKSAGGSKKRASATRKPSALKATEIPEDEDLYAALEAALENGMSDQEKSPPKRNVKKSEPSHRASDASVARSDAAATAEEEVNESESHHSKEAQFLDGVEDVPERKTKPQKASSKRKVTAKKPAHKDEEPKVEHEPEVEDQIPHESDIRPSRPDDDNIELGQKIGSEKPNDSGAESDASSPEKPAKKPTKKKATATKTKKPSKQSKSKAKPQIEETHDVGVSNEAEEPHDAKPEKPVAVLMEIDDDDDELQGEPEDHETARQSSKVPPKSAERYSTLSQQQRRSGSIRRFEDVVDPTPQRPQRKSERRSDHSAVSMPQTAPVAKSTPSPSPQSSDAENRPPSSRPLSARPPTETKSVTVPLAAGPPTFSPSKRPDNTGYLNTTRPWTPLDIEELLLSGLDGKDNADLNTVLDEAKGALTSPEKKMTVMDWISWNAKNGEEKLKNECERLVGIFEREGGRAMMALEGLECVE